MLGGILGVLDPWFPESNEERLRAITRRLAGTVVTFAQRRGPAARIADAIGPRFPFIYAESSFLGLARRWKTQFEENAKRLAAFDEIPELFHNALVGWDAIPRAEARRNAVLLLEWSGTGPLVRQSVKYLEHLLLSKGVRAIRVPLSSEDRLEALLDGLSLGDHASLFLADRRRVDPLPVDAIVHLKNALAPPSAHPGVRRPQGPPKSRPAASHR
jgi:glucose/mannose-6-phosphate isomerase